MQLAKYFISIIVMSAMTSCAAKVKPITHSSQKIEPVTAVSGKAKTLVYSSPEIKPATTVKISGEYTKVYRVEDVPLVITDYFNKDKNCAGIANPDAEFNSSCAVGNGGNSAPCSKLISAGNAGDIWFIEYVTGGAGVSQTFLSFRLKDNLVTSLGNIYNQAQLVKLSIKDLDNQLSNTSCIKDDYFRYYYQIKYGVCPSPKEGRFIGMTPSN